MKDLIKFLKDNDIAYRNIDTQLNTIAIKSCNNPTLIDLINFCHKEKFNDYNIFVSNGTLYIKCYNKQ